MKFLIAIVLAALCAQPARAAQTITFSLPSIQMFEAPYLVAADKGYFAEEGLDFKYVLANGGVATPALMSGSIDASASSASALAAIMKGAPLRIVLVLQNHGLYSLWSTRPEIRTLADVKGKQIAIETRGDAGEVATRIALQAAGISPDAVGYTPLGTANAANAMSGLAPAFVLASTDVTVLRASGELSKAHLVMDYKNIHIPIDGLAVAQKLITDHPDVLKKMLRAIVKGMLYTRAFKAQTIAILLKSLPNSNAAVEGADYDAFLSGLTPDLIVPNSDLRNDLDVHAVLLNMPRESVPPIDAIYDFAPLRAAEAEIRASGWKPAP
ncbi:MAG TPA: ABC transporter substrate-binding protein [Candidatus Lustribacter sp.]|nr:ABC transporter substrate-binding protein [Candidatus Lustribacter sp.]